MGRVMWQSLVTGMMVQRAFGAMPPQKGECRFVRATPHPELWLSAWIGTRVGGDAVDSSVGLSLTYRESAAALRVSRILSHPLDTPGGWAHFRGAKTQREYIQWFCDTAEDVGKQLFDDESIGLLERTVGLRRAVKPYMDRLPEAESLWELENELCSGMSEADRAAADRLGFAATSMSGTGFAAGLCFLRFEREVEGGLLFERDFTVPRDKPFWKLPGPDGFTGHPGVQRIQLLSDKVFLWGREREFPEFAC
jgi:hypothetical protein